MTRVLIASAAYGGQNIGDDAILVAMVDQLKNVESEIEITAVTRQSDEMGRRLAIRTLELEGFANRVRTYAAIASVDVLIVGGGALIAEYTRGWRGLVTGHPGYPMTMLLAAILLRKKTMVYGVGVEEIQSPWARFFVRHIYNRADVITVRDQDSKDRLMHALGVERPRILATADPVLALGGSPEIDATESLRPGESGSSRRPLVVINFAYGVDRRDALLDFISSTADHVISEFGARVLFVPMNVMPTADRCGMQGVLARMKHSDDASILELPYSHHEVLAIVSGAELVISSRMHLLIFSALTCTPILGISRVPKVDAFLGHYGLRAGASTSDLDFDKFSHVLDETWGKREEIKKKLAEKKATLAALARSNATILAEIAAGRS
ncbi:MAG: hypothetical protein GY937_09500 [bacterium]|nr:hypothetical protein [bacterium]